MSGSVEGVGSGYGELFETAMRWALGTNTMLENGKKTFTDLNQAIGAADRQFQEIAKATQNAYQLCAGQSIAIDAYNKQQGALLAKLNTTTTTLNHATQQWLEVRQQKEPAKIVPAALQSILKDLTRPPIKDQEYEVLEALGYTT